MFQVSLCFIDYSNKLQDGYSGWYTMKNNTLLIILIFVFVVTGSDLIFHWSKVIDDNISDILFRIRGPRPASDDFLFIQLSDADIQALGGWPITRDYFAYLIHLLSQKSPKVIALDFLLDFQSQTYPEYDDMLARFMKTSGNVILPSVYYEENSQINFISPAQPFKKEAKDIGFSNLGDPLILRKMPIQLSINDSSQYSFGTVIAKNYLNGHLNPQIQSRQNLRINHFGSLDQVNTLGFVQAIKTFESKTDSIHVKDKIIVIGATATSLPALKKTPFCNHFPATLAHLTVAENIIQGKWIKTSPMLVEYLFSVIFCWTACMLFRRKLIRYLTEIGFLIVGFMALSMLSFSLFNLLLPAALPLILVFGAVLIQSILLMKNKQQTHDLFKIRLQNRIQQKEIDLNEAESRLAELHEEVKQAQKDHKQLSRQTNALIQDKEKAVQTLEKHLRDLEQAKLPDHEEAASYETIIYSPDSPMHQVLNTVAKIGNHDIAVLIIGETGTGKELIAKALHDESKRHARPFIAVNCGALSESLLESELFGHEKGGFTGATTQRKGRFELAHGGTLFLDEITETSPAFQSRLLRILQEGTFERLGGEKTIKTDVRIIAATNKDIKAEISQGHFREDVYYRLNGFTIELPPLRERIKDCPLLIRHFIQKYSQKINGISQTANTLLNSYHWPGNVRELENVIRRAVILAESDNREMIQQNDLPENLLDKNNIDQPLFTLEDQILQLLRRFEFSHTSIRLTAEALGNRDRGTITEYFKGVCFKTFVESQFDLNKTVENIAGTDTMDIQNRVEKKLKQYLKGIEQLSLKDLEQIENGTELPSIFKGLPQKYYSYLNQIIKHQI